MLAAFAQAENSVSGLAHSQDSTSVQKYVTGLQTGKRQFTQNGKRYLRITNVQITNSTKLQQTQNGLSGKAAIPYSAQYAQSLANSAKQAQIIAKKGNMVFIKSDTDQAQVQTATQPKIQASAKEKNNTIKQLALVNQDNGELAVLTNYIIAKVTSKAYAEQLATDYALELVQIIGQTQPTVIYRTALDTIFDTTESMRQKSGVLHVSADIVENFSQTH